MEYPKHIPKIVRPLAKQLVFDIPNASNEIYITFDDGPHPVITPWILNQLKEYSARATFFLIGQNAERYPELVQLILDEGHHIGNHSHSHVNGWKTKNALYMEEAMRCSEYVESRLFRPPYGRITRSQAQELREASFKVVFWSDLSADFDSKYSWEDCVRFATRNVTSGSIIVFHDSDKAWPRLEKALPECLKFYREQGFKMSVIPD